MADYGKFCPVALATEVIADRWTPLVIRELIMGNTRFNDIARGLPGMSRSLLVQRLRHLDRQGVIETVPSPTGRGSEYNLTAAGRALEPVVAALALWAVDWLYDDLHPEDVDAVTLTWWMHRRLDATGFTGDRTVIQLDHTAPKRISVWLVLERGEVSLCRRHPGYEVDVVLAADTPTLSRVFNGFDTWTGAVASGSLQVDGPRRLVDQVARLFPTSPFAPAVRARIETAALTT